MPEIFDREMARLARPSSPPLFAPLAEIVLDLEQLRGEAMAGGYTTVAAAIDGAAAIARKAMADETAIAA